MALYLIRATKPNQKNATGVNAFIVDAADATAARAAARAAAPNGGSKPKASWEAVALADVAAAGPLVIEGNVVLPAAAEHFRTGGQR